MYTQPKCFLYSIEQQAGYEYVKETDLSKPLVYLEGSNYKFATTLISATPLPRVAKEPKCLYIKIS